MKLIVKLLGIKVKVISTHNKKECSYLGEMFTKNILINQLVWLGEEEEEPFAILEMVFFMNISRIL